MELILAVIVLIIIFSIGFLVGNKQLLKKESGYTQPWVDPNFKHQPTASFNPPHFKDIPKWSSLNNDTMGTIGSKPKTQTDYQREHKAEDETPAIDFMHNWIQEKSGKKPVSQKRKPKTTKEWEDEFDIGGNS
jgi:hypothetical protein